MGASDQRPPPLPAPTETSSDNFGNTTSDEVATDISRRTDRTSYSIPEDGSPVTVPIRRKVRGDSESGRSSQSQTSLLIEYFEGAKSKDKLHSRQSVRVRVTPSRRKEREGSDHIQTTETGKTRKPAYTRRISLGSKKEERLPLPAGTDVSGYSADSKSSDPPLEVEVLQHASDVSRFSDLAGNSPYPTQALDSNVSSIPPDSMLDGEEPARIHTPPRQRSPLVEEPGTTSTVRASERQGSLSREREITHRVMEKIAQKEGSGKLSPSTRRSGSREYVVEDRPSSRKRTSSDSRRTDESIVPGSSLNPSDISHRSERSARSGTSNVSINNPKLLQTVEDAIKRLILPELNAVKEEQRIQRNRSKFEHERPESVSTTKSEGLERRMSKSSSAPDVKESKPKIVVSDEVDELKSKKTRKDRRPSKESERSRHSSDTITKDGQRVRRKSSGRDHSGSTRAAKDAALALGAGALTAAALRHHDSLSSVESGERRRRKKRSKSRSRSASVSEEAERRENIPPMPLMESEVHSDLTRDSILSADTERPPSGSSRSVSTPTREYELRQVATGSPRHVAIDESAASPTRTPTRTPTSLRDQPITQSGVNVSTQASNSNSAFHKDIAPVAAGAIAGLGPPVFSRLQDIGGLHESMSANTLEHYTPQRPLSPIQSVSSYRDSTVGPVEPAQHSRVQSIKSEASLTSPKKQHVHRPGSARSAGSYASSGSSEFIHSKDRPAGFSLEPGYEIMSHEYEPETPPGEEFDETPRPAEVDDWFDRGHEDNERYRHEYEEDNLRDSGADYVRDSGEYNRDSTYTMDSSNNMLDRVTAGQGLRNVHNMPDYVHTPVAVESAVASLHEPSSLSVHSSQDSLQKMGSDRDEYEIGAHDNSSKERWGVLRDKAQALHNQGRKQQAYVDSAEQSPVTPGEKPKMMSSAIPVPGEDIPVIGIIDDEEVVTNPSIIRGPMGGSHYGNRDHWPYGATPPISSRRQRSADGDIGHHAELGTTLGAAAAGAAVGLGLAHATSSDDPAYDRQVAEHEYDDRAGADPAQAAFAAPNHYSSTPLKDEGYISAQRGEYTPDPFDEDIFLNKRQVKHLSGMSHGMDSPLYDAATGKGIDRIQSKDVVALMDHLTVRDAQRNARDTEILVTLVRSAAEMRNSFEDMKNFIIQQDRMIMQNTDRDAEHVIHKLGGPRAMPASSARSRKAASSDDGDDVQTRRQNVFRRALKGLSMRSTSDLTKIEDMLMQLLNEVEGLKDAPAVQRAPTQMGSTNSHDYLRQPQDPGYEPEGRAGTSSSPNQSGYFSNTSTRVVREMHSGYDGRRDSVNRISTVLEADEEGYNEDGMRTPTQFAQEDRMTTPTQEVQRQNSETTPRQHAAPFRSSQDQSQQTPRTGRSSKYRSQSSSFFGNFANKVSRWSKTTASTDHRVSQDRPVQRPYSEASRSGSDVNINPDDGQYYLDEDDRLGGDEQARPPSPLIPENEIDDPRYQAHRNSINLQHPQPRPGPTHRHQYHLEDQAQNYYESLLDDGGEADQWGSNPSLALNKNLNRVSTSTGGGLSPVYSDNRSVHSASEQTQPQPLASNPPPRPPKIKDDGPLVPEDAQAGANGHNYNASMSGAAYLPTALEPIQEARYSLETERTGRNTESSRHMTPSPNPQQPPSAMQNVQRRITGPRPMGSRSSSASTGAVQPSSSGQGYGQGKSGSPSASASVSPGGSVSRKPLSVRSATSDSTLLSYRTSLDEDEIF